MTEAGPTAGLNGAAGLMGRFAGVLLSPTETLRLVAVQPRWIGMLTLTTAVSVICVASFLSTEVGQQAWVDRVVTQLETFGGDVSDAQYDRLQQMASLAPYLASGQMVLLVPLTTAAIAGILFAAFNVGLGGDATYKQVLATVSHAGAVTAVREVFVTPLNYARESLSSPTNVAVFFPMLDDSSFLARLLGTVDFFAVWWTMILAIGLSVLYRRPTRGVALGLFAVYSVIAAGIAFVVTVMQTL